MKRLISLLITELAYVELDTGEEGRDSNGMSFDCQLSVKFRKKEGRSEQVQSRIQKNANP